MKFWLPMVILLTAISPNLEAETVDPLDNLTAQPYLLELQLQNVDFSGFTWTADVTVEDYDPVNEIISGELDWKANGSLFASRGFRGRLTEDGAYTSVKIFPYIGTIWLGQFSEDFMNASGIMQGVGTSDMEGSWKLTAIEIPTPSLLMLCAVGSIFLFSRKRYD